jgi:hypothetical protein
MDELLQWERDLGDALLIPITKRLKARRLMVGQERYWAAQKKSWRGANPAVALYCARNQASQNIALLTHTASQYNPKHETKLEGQDGLTTHTGLVIIEYPGVPLQ